MCRVDKLFDLFVEFIVDGIIVGLVLVKVILFEIFLSIYIFFLDLIFILFEFEKGIMICYYFIFFLLS